MAKMGLDKATLLLFYVYVVLQPKLMRRSRKQYLIVAYCIEPSLTVRKIMVSVLVQMLGGFLGGLVVGKIVHTSDMGFFWNAIAGAFGGVFGGQLVGLVFAKTQLAAGVDFIAVIGPFIDGALTGGLIQIFVGMYLRRQIERSTASRRGSHL
jgi:uncharacterized membrane protein YeaQ/YmgE (transglycosylase-associated protein family)